MTIAGARYQLLRRDDGPGWWCHPMDEEQARRRLPVRYATGIPWSEPAADPVGDLMAASHRAFDRFLLGDLVVDPSAGIKVTAT
ncbi:hypothetical protein KIH74_23045 [Kineosporia sp. J2-2]|uniref:Uncharacterized protein n=1 Tax=Kineosporia corallincola TaxID=2835133 RepID=A0ABS5TL59_9ACTN|nr:hypothetical protein [Kineosporia corallincola]MBT0771837.1 hypothetical protein [Kineosporia corallincola]